MSPEETNPGLQAIDATDLSTWRRAFALAGPALGAQLLGLDRGLYGCWMAMQADLWFRGGLFFWRFLAGRRQKTQV